MPRKEKVTRVNDGDTFETTSLKQTIRLANVNATEKNTKAGPRSIRILRDLIGGETVTVDTVARDKYVRSVAVVSVGGKSVNRAMNKKLDK